MSQIEDKNSINQYFIYLFLYLQCVVNIEGYPCDKDKVFLEFTCEYLIFNYDYSFKNLPMPVFSCVKLTIVLEFIIHILL